MVRDILNHEDFRGWHEEDVKAVVAESFSKGRPRFEVEEAAGKGLMIRATHRHSIGKQPPRTAPARVVQDTKGGTAKTFPPHPSPAPPTCVGDWTRPGCGRNAFAMKSACRKYGTQRLVQAPASAADDEFGGDRRGNQICPTCGGRIFGRKGTCSRCSTQRPVQAVMNARGNGRGEDQPGDWICPKCGDNVFARKSACRKCGTRRSSDTVQPTWLGAGPNLEPPFYWTSTQKRNAWSIVPTQGFAEHAAFEAGFEAGGTLGGRDQRTRVDYSGLKPYFSWRLQHPGLWGKYAMERENMRQLEVASLQDNGLFLPVVELREPYKQMATQLPGSLDQRVNEVFLSHGTRPENVAAILSGGLNERFSGGLFGHGTYLAEDIAKNDQYCTYDEHHGAHPELHDLLFSDPSHHPGQLLYVFVCRVLLGYPVRTKDGQMDEAGRSIWSSEGRELATVPGSSPPLLHHSLLVETGGVVARFRELILFHGDRIYPEYLVAYQRCK